MRRLIYDVDSWDVYQHRDARDLPLAKVSDTNELKFQDELFERLFAGEALKELPSTPDVNGVTSKDIEFARSMHDGANSLPDFQRLAEEVKGDVFKSSIATHDVYGEIVRTVREQAKRGADKKSLERAIRGAIRRGTKNAKEDIVEAEEAIEGSRTVNLQGDGRGTGAAKHESVAKQMQETLRLVKSNKKLALIAKLAGRFKRIALRKSKSKTKHGADEITNIETGDNISRLIPTELGRLSNPMMKRAFLKDLNEKACLQYQIQGSEPKGQGPIVVCLDKSGSMSSGSRDEWATAVAIALMDRAWREKRKFAIIMFDGRIMFSKVYAVGEKVDMETLCIAPNGGTSFEAAMTEAIRVIKTEKSMGRSDVVIVTDGAGECGIDNLNDIRKSLHIKSFGIAIEGNGEVLKQWCDAAVSVSSMDSLTDKTAEMLFGNGSV